MAKALTKTESCLRVPHFKTGKVSSGQRRINASLKKNGEGPWDGSAGNGACHQPDNLCSIAGVHTVGGKNWAPRVVLWTLQAHPNMHTPTYVVAYALYAFNLSTEEAEHGQPGHREF